MTVSVVVPTIAGREAGYAGAVESFSTDCEVIPCRDFPTCGAAWVDGARRATGDYICFTADDLEAHKGFCSAMVEAVDEDKLPAALVLEPGGSKQSCGGAGGDVCRGNCEDRQAVEWSPTPFIHRDWWEWIELHATFLASIHYSTDRLISAICARNGVPSVFRAEAVMTHHNDQVGRLGSAGADGFAFDQYMAQL